MSLASLNQVLHISRVEGNFLQNENHEGEREGSELIGYIMRSFQKFFVFFFFLAFPL